jgi:hypothetical protein
MALEARTTAWVPFYCSQDRTERAATFRLVDGVWQLAVVSGEPVEEGGEPGDFPVAGRFGTAPGYQGCPACGRKGFCRCGHCDSVSCWVPGSTTITCGHCKRESRVTGPVTKMSANDVA